MAQAIPLALMAASQLYSGVTQNQAAKAQAKVLDENARRAELGGELEAAGIQREERAVSGEAIVASADNGVALGTGSALDLLRQNAIEREWGVLSARYNARSEAAGLRRQAAQTRKAGKQALIGSVLSAGASALSASASNKNSAALAAANERVRTAQLPGGMKLPTPNPVGGYGGGN